MTVDGRWKMLSRCLMLDERWLVDGTTQVITKQLTFEHLVVGLLVRWFVGRHLEKAINYHQLRIHHQLVPPKKRTTGIIG